jgi:hypothetical protein
MPIDLYRLLLKARIEVEDYTHRKVLMDRTMYARSRKSSQLDASKRTGGCDDPDHLSLCDGRSGRLCGDIEWTRLSLVKL